MRKSSITKTSLLGATAIAGAAALTLTTAPAWAQSGATGVPTRPADQSAPQPGVAQPNSDDQNQVTDEATAQDATPPADEAEVEAVIVTGSRIRRDPTNAPTALIQLNREEILATGQPNVIDYLADVPALQQSQVPEDTTGASLGTLGLSLLNLRNLGAARTLVLVDSRRHVGGSPGTSSVDIDTIPQLLIENTEIITGAASAQYGADAVSGVVNFILRRNFEGIEIDAVSGQISKETGVNNRVSGLIGRNFLDDRLNLYATAEYQRSDRVRDSDLEAFDTITQIQNDLDPTDPANGSNTDGVLDVRRIGPGVVNIQRSPGGSLTLARTAQPSALNDPDIPVAGCPAFSATNRFSANCFVLDPGFTFTFNNQGASRPVNFGTDRAPAGLNRNLVVGSEDGLPIDFQNTDRLPEAEATRFQTGFNFDVNPAVQLFGEAKYVREEAEYEFQPAFFDIGLRRFGANEATTITGINTFEIGYSDNAFLDPAIKKLIDENRVTIFSAPTLTNPGQPTGTPRLDQRARFQNFTFDLGTRPQRNTRELERYVVGIRGDRDRVGFIDNFAYELGYTYGKVADENEEFNTVDTQRFAFAADSILVNGVPTCRVKELVARGQTIVNAATGEDFAPNDPTIANCVPIRIFGNGGVTQEARDYINVNFLRTNENTQQDVLGFISGEILGGFLPGGPIGLAVGAEYRKETASGTTDQRFNDRLLFGNAGPDFEEASFDVNEYFAEVRIPILKDVPLAEDLELTLTGRRSEYSTIGEQDAYGISFLYRPSRDFALRGSYGRSVRAPDLSELFSPQSVNFNTVTDNCSSLVIQTTADERIRNNRIRNCAALGVPTTFIDPLAGQSKQGRLGGNPDLAPEVSDSYTFSTIFTPRFAPGLSLVLDFYDIKLTDAIATLTVQAILNQCTDLDAANPNACALIIRDPNTFAIVDFLQAPVNFAALRARGMDFNARYGFDLEQLDFVGLDVGRLDFSLRGNYNLRRQNFVNPTSPGLATNLDSTIGDPRVRLRLGTTYTYDKIAFTWEVDHQTSQEIFDSQLLLDNPDSRDPSELETGGFTQHDFTVRYDLTDNVRIRGGVVNAFNETPDVQTIRSGDDDIDIFDLFGRRFFIGANLRFGAAAR